MKSVETHIIQGTYRRDRHEKKVQMRRLKKVPEPPQHLSKVEAKIFLEIARKLHGNDLLSGLDVYALESYAVQLALSRKAKAELEQSGEYVVEYINKNGSKNMVPSPWLIVLKNSADILLKLGAKLGLSPADRAKASRLDGDPAEGKSLLR